MRWGIKRKTKIKKEIKLPKRKCDQVKPDIKGGKQSGNKTEFKKKKKESPSINTG